MFGRIGAVRTIAGSTTILVTDKIILATGAGVLTIALPPAANHLGRAYVILSQIAGVSLTPYGAETVEGETLYSWGFGSRTIVAVSPTEWRIIAGW